MKRFGTMLAAAAVSAALVLPSAAYAVSYPYVEDVNDCGANHSVLTVTAIGEGKLTLKAKCGEPLKVVRHHRGVWTVVVPNGELVKLIAKDANGKRAIKYEVC